MSFLIIDKFYGLQKHDCNSSPETIWNMQNLEVFILTITHVSLNTHRAQIVIRHTTASFPGNLLSLSLPNCDGSTQGT